MGRIANVNMEVRIKEIARRVLWGQPHSEIMAEMSLSYQQFHTAISSPLYRETARALEQTAYQALDEKYRGEMETVQSKARGEALTAVDTLITLMKGSASENLKRDCAKDIIEYAGESDANKRPVIQINHATFTLLEQTREMEETRGRTIDVRPTESVA